MKKLIVSIASLCLVLALAIPVSFAYDYREDKLRDEEYFSSISALEESILDTLSLKDYTTLGTSDAPKSNSLDFDSAVRVFTFKPDEFLDALKAGFAEEMKVHDQYVWNIPAPVTDDGYAFAIITNKNEKDFGYSTVFGDKTALDDIPLSYIYEKDSVNSLLETLSFDSVYITSIQSWNIDLVTLISGDSVQFIPYAARPEFFDLKNGTVYSETDMTKILKSYEASSSFSPVSGGGSGAAAELVATVLSAGAVVCGVAALVAAVVFVRNRRKIT